MKMKPAVPLYVYDAAEEKLQKRETLNKLGNARRFVKQIHMAIDTCTQEDIIIIELNNGFIWRGTGDPDPAMVALMGMTERGGVLDDGKDT